MSSKYSPVFIVFMSQRGLIFRVVFLVCFFFSLEPKATLTCLCFISKGALQAGGRSGFPACEALCEVLRSVWAGVMLLQHSPDPEHLEVPLVWPSWTNVLSCGSGRCCPCELTLLFSQIPTPDHRTKTYKEEKALGISLFNPHPRVEFMSFSSKTKPCGG